MAGPARRMPELQLSFSIPRQPEKENGSRTTEGREKENCPNAPAGGGGRPGREKWTFGRVYTAGARAAEEAAYALVPMALWAEALLGGRGDRGGAFLGKSMFIEGLTGRCANPPSLPLLSAPKFFPPPCQQGNQEWKIECTESFPSRRCQEKGLGKSTQQKCHRIIASFRLEGPPNSIPPAITFHYSRLLKVLCNLALNSARDGASATSLCNLFQ